MSFWDIFKTDDAKSNFSSGLHEKVATILPESPESDQILVTCIAGLMARVAYVDFEIHKGEEKLIEESLTNWTNLNKEDVLAIKVISLEEIKNLAGLENQKYCHPLNDLLDNNDKYKLLIALFAVAAGDGEVSQNESEEIRLISKGLLLEPKHFISARATVVENLASLKK